MSLYNALFGTNEEADALLATLELDRTKVGRFRDCYLEGDKIVVHTRNGGGNRDCWCSDNPKYGYPDCANDPVDEETPETMWLSDTDPPCQCMPNIHSTGPTPDGRWGTTHLHRTGRTVTKTYYHCLEPKSALCACPGCIISHRLPAHPQYFADSDDGFDSTYANIYFHFPEKYAEGLAARAAGAEFPSRGEQWQALLDALNEAAK